MCDSVVAVGSETAAGQTLFAKNSDRKPGECQPFLQFPAAHHPPRASVRCTHIEIPQVAESYRVMGHSPWWVWGFEHGVNEHGVAIGNHTIFSREPVEQAAGLIGMDLVRLGLERGRSAREALEVIATLVETYGQGGAAFAPGSAGYHNSFLLADPGEAWILETSNRRWAARRARLESVSNHVCLANDWEIASRDLEPFARNQGWWRKSARLDVAAAYRNFDVPGRISEGRFRRAAELLREGRGRHDVDSLMRLLRDHGECGSSWRPGATPEEERFFTLCAHSEPVHRTTASLIAELPADREAPWPVWVSFSSPCTSLFLPVYLDGVIPAALARGGEGPSAESAWWAFESLREAASADYPKHTPMIREAWAAFEERVAAERREAEVKAAAARGGREALAAPLSEFMARTVEEAMKLADRMCARIR